MSTAIITANIDETDSKNFAAFCEDRERQCTRAYRGLR